LLQFGVYGGINLPYVRKFRNHYLIADGKMYKCAVCSFITKYNASISTHVRGHANDKQFACKMCNRQFIGQSNLITHMKIHQADIRGDKPYACNICDFRCKLKEYLQKHMLKHFPNKSVSCPHCDKKFEYSSLLKRHLVYHGTETPFKCQVCNRGFKAKHILKRHFDTHREGNVTKHCIECGLTCSNKDAYNLHMTTTHCDNTLDSKQPGKTGDGNAANVKEVCEAASNVTETCSAQDAPFYIDSIVYVTNDSGESDPSYTHMYGADLVHQSQVVEEIVETVITEGV